MNSMKQNYLPVGGINELSAKYLDMIEEKPEYKILDVGFGTGTLSLLAINYIKSKFGDKKITIYGIENDTYLLNYLPNLGQQKILLEQNKILDSLSNRRVFEQNKIRIRLLDKDIKTSLEELPNDFDYVFFDLFGPSKHEADWNQQIFENLYLKLKEGGKLATHTASTQVQINLTRAGFEVNNLEQKEPGITGSIATKNTF